MFDLYLTILHVVVLSGIILACVMALANQRSEKLNAPRTEESEERASCDI